MYSCGWILVSPESLLSEETLEELLIFLSASGWLSSPALKCPTLGDAFISPYQCYTLLSAGMCKNTNKPEKVL